MNLFKATNILCVILMVSFVGCSKKEDQSQQSKGETQSQAQTQPSSDLQGNLTREKAKELLIAKYKYPITIDKRVVIESKGTDGWVSIADREDAAYSKAGLLTYSSNGSVNSEEGLTVKCSFTPEGQKYVIGNPEDSSSNFSKGIAVSVKLCEENFNKITGILPVEGLGVKAAQVEYETILNKQTPFCLSKDDTNCNGTQNKKAIFVLYDDGWRIKE